MKMQIPRMAMCAVACVVLILAGLVLAQLLTAAPANPPIVLHYREAPIFLGPHEHSVTSIAFSPDGKTLATGANDGYLRLWDSATGQLKLMVGDDSTRGINGLAFSPDGRVVAAAGGLGSDAQIWETATGKVVRVFEEQGVPPDAPFIYKGKPITARAMHAAAFSPDGRILATAGEGVILRDAQSGSTLATLKQPAKGVKAIAFSPDGKTLATAAEDRKVRLWSVPGGDLVETLVGATQPLNGVAISPDARRIVATGSGGRSIFKPDENPIGYLWSWERPSGPARKIEIGNVHVRPVAFIAPTTVILGAGREVLTLDLQGDDSIPPRRDKIGSHSEDVLAVAVSPDGRLVASGGVDRTVDVVEAATGKLVHRLPGLTDIIASVATSSDGKRFATATIDVRFSTRRETDEVRFADRYKRYFSDSNVERLRPSEVHIWSTSDGRLQSTLPLPPSQVTAIDFIPQSDQLAVAGWVPGKGGMLAIWDSTSGKQVREFKVQAAEVLSICVSTDGRTVASGDADGNVDLWDVQSGAKTRSHKHDHPVEAVAFSADGKLLATGNANRTVRLFDSSGGNLVRTLKSRSYVESLDFSPDASLLAAGTRDPGLELWDLRVDTASRTLTAHTLVAPGDHFAIMPGYVAFSPDGRFVVCGGKGKDIAVFDAAKRTLHGELRGHFHVSTTAAFLPDGRLISGAEERTVRLWDIDQMKQLATWIVMPADQKQNWGNEWIGYTPSGRFAGSTRLERLVGWQTDGVVIGPEDADRRQRVESLFEAAAEPASNSAEAVRAEDDTGGNQGIAATDERAAHEASPGESAAPNGKTSSLVGRFIYDGEPFEPKRLAIPPDIETLDGQRHPSEERLRFSKIEIPDERLIVGKDRGIANVVVWIRSKTIPKTSVGKGALAPVIVRAKEGRFQPHVLAFWNAAPLKVVNEMLPSGLNFNWAPLQGQSHNPLLSAERPEYEFKADAERLPVAVSSNVQPWMRAYILPLDHPYFAVTRKDGRFELADVPPGTWGFAFWHETSGWLQTDRFPDGRFIRELRPGENSLGDLLVNPETFSENRGRAAEAAAFVPPDPYPELGHARNAGPGWHFLRVAGHPQAALDLGIAPEQQEDIKLLFDAYLQKDRDLEAKLRQEHGTLPADQWEQRRQEQWLKARELARRLLDESQVRRVEQTMVLREMYHAFLVRDVQQHLELSEGQLLEINSAIKRHAQRGGRDSLVQLGTDIRRILSAEQRARFDELRGLAEQNPLLHGQ